MLNSKVWGLRATEFRQLREHTVLFFPTITAFWLYSRIITGLNLKFKNEYNDKEKILRCHEFITAGQRVEETRKGLIG